MSRGGRGGGRGGRGGGGPKGVTMDLIRDNMDDLGLDAFQPMENSGPPPLYPQMELAHPPQPKTEDIFSILKMKEATAK